MANNEQEVTKSLVELLESRTKLRGDQLNSRNITNRAKGQSPQNIKTVQDKLKEKEVDVEEEQLKTLRLQLRELKELRKLQGGGRFPEKIDRGKEPIGGFKFGKLLLPMLLGSALAGLPGLLLGGLGGLGALGGAAGARGLGNLMNRNKVDPKVNKPSTATTDGSDRKSTDKKDDKKDGKKTGAAVDDGDKKQDKDKKTDKKSGAKVEPERKPSTTTQVEEVDRKGGGKTPRTTSKAAGVAAGAITAAEAARRAYEKLKKSIREKVGLNDDGTRKQVEKKPEEKATKKSEKTTKVEAADDEKKRKEEERRLKKEKTARVKAEIAQELEEEKRERERIKKEKAEQRRQQKLNQQTQDYDNKKSNIDKQTDDRVRAKAEKDKIAKEKAEKQAKEKAEKDAKEKASKKVEPKASADDAASKKSILKRVGKQGLKLIPFVGTAAAVGMSADAAVSGYDDAEELLDIKGREATTTEKISGGIGGVAEELSLGTIDRKDAAKKVDQVLDSIQDFFSGDKVTKPRDSNTGAALNEDTTQMNDMRSNMGPRSNQVPNIINNNTNINNSSGMNNMPLIQPRPSESSIDRYHNKSSAY